MRKLFRDLLLAKGYTYDQKFDWIIKTSLKIFHYDFSGSDVKDKLGGQVGKNFIINRIISKQNDGKIIFQGMNTKTNLKVAIKVEPIFIYHP